MDRLPAGIDLRTRLRHVRWIGGGSGAGKTTVARLLAEQYSLRLYSTDDRHADGRSG
jgi:uridine kinase